MALNRPTASSNDLHDMHENDGPNREITLGTSTILGIFFGLALLCALFFGFGYTVGRKSVPTPTAAADTSDSGFKPSAGSPAIQPIPGYLSAKEAAAANQAPTGQVSAPASPSTPVNNSASGNSARTVTLPTEPPTATTQQLPAAVTRMPEAAAVAPAPPAATLPPLQSIGSAPAMVQIAAVSHQEDADLLLQALRSHGYNVFVRQEQDHLLHVQIGPFASRKDADAMRQRLLADGYNAIVK